MSKLRSLRLNLAKRCQRDIFGQHRIPRNALLTSLFVFNHPTCRKDTSDRAYSAALTVKNLAIESVNGDCK